jgi:hypothetical protein
MRLIRIYGVPRASPARAHVETVEGFHVGRVELEVVYLRVGLDA